MVCLMVVFGFLGRSRIKSYLLFLPFSFLFFIIKLIKESFQFMDLYESKASSKGFAFQKCANEVYGI